MKTLITTLLAGVVLFAPVAHAADQERKIANVLKAYTCEACGAWGAAMYARKPQSSCALKIGSALRGDAVAKQELADNWNICPQTGGLENDMTSGQTTSAISRWIKYNFDDEHSITYYYDDDYTGRSAFKLPDGTMEARFLFNDTNGQPASRLFSVRFDCKKRLVKEVYEQDYKEQMADGQPLLLGDLAPKVDHQWKPAATSDWLEEYKLACH